MDEDTGQPVEPLDRDELADALADGDLRVLLMCLFHLLKISGTLLVFSPPTTT